MFIEKLHNSELLLTLISTVVKADANVGLQSLDSSGLTELFTSCANDPSLANLMVAANKELANELNNTNDAKAIFSSTTGQKLMPEEPVTHELLVQISTLDVITPGTEWSFHSLPNLVCTSSTVEDRTNPDAPVIYDTIGKLLEKFGKSVFDKAVSSIDAQAKKDDLAILADQQRLGDELAMETTLTEQGGSSEQSDAIEFEIGSIEADLKRRLQSVFESDIEKLATNACKNIQSQLGTLRSHTIFDDFIPRQ